MRIAAANAGKSIEIPVGVGFCLYIRRECLDEIGYFDEAKFGKGYGEEVAFCMQATKAGTAACSPATCSSSTRAKSPSARVRPSAEKAGAGDLDELDPEFQPLVRDFVVREPARPLRRAVDIARLRASPARACCLPATDGRAASGATCATSPRCSPKDSEVLLLKPYSKQLLALEWMREGEAFEAFFDPRAPIRKGWWRCLRPWASRACTCTTSTTCRSASSRCPANSA